MRDDVTLGLSGAALLAIIVGICVATGLLIYGLNGWGQVQDAKRQGVINNIESHNYVHNYGYQQAQRDAVTSDMAEIVAIPAQMAGQSTQEVQALGAQRANALYALCSDASKVDPSQGPLPDAAFVSANCSGSTPNPSSPYITHPNDVNP